MVITSRGRSCGAGGLCKANVLHAKSNRVCWDDLVHSNGAIGGHHRLTRPAPLGQACSDCINMLGPSN